MSRETIQKVAVPPVIEDKSISFESADAAVLLIAKAIDEEDLKWSKTIADEALVRFPDDWRIHQQTARYYELAARAKSKYYERGIDTSRLSAAYHYFRATELVARSPNNSSRSTEFLSLFRSNIDELDTHAASLLSNFVSCNPSRGPLLIALSTLPKSASTYVWMSLANGLRFMPVRILVGVGGDQLSNSAMEVVNLELLEKARIKGGNVAQGHFSPNSARNRAAINKLEHVLVHVRDPRQTVLSWAHYFTDLAWVNNQGHNEIASVFSHLDLADRLTIAIDLHLPGQVFYLEEWMNACKKKLLTTRVKFLRQEDLVVDSVEYFNSILDFLEIDREMFIQPTAPEMGKLHYRKGLLNEWRDVLNENQIRKVQQMVSDELLQFFSWTR